MTVDNTVNVKKTSKCIKILFFSFPPERNLKHLCSSWNKFATYTFFSVDKWNKKQTETFLEPNIFWHKFLRHVNDL